MGAYEAALWRTLMYRGFSHDHQELGITKEETCQNHESRRQQSSCSRRRVLARTATTHTHTAWHARKNARTHAPGHVRESVQAQRVAGFRAASPYRGAYSSVVLDQLLQVLLIRQPPRRFLLLVFVAHPVPFLPGLKTHLLFRGQAYVRGKAGKDKHPRHSPHHTTPDIRDFSSVIRQRANIKTAHARACVL